jgi:hypothetical protein
MITISMIFVFVAIVFWQANASDEQLFSSPATDPVLQESNSVSHIQPSNDTVDIGLWLINAFDYQYTTGYCTIDMYLYFFWSSSNLTSIDWQFANGYPITPSSITLIDSKATGDIKYEVYRATARLNSPPDASDFPFDKINLTVSVNVFTHGNSIKLSWLGNQTGLDAKFYNPGWKTERTELSTSLNSYPLGVQVPRADMVVIQQRQREASSFSPFLPPLFFSLVCAISFLFSLKEMGAVGLRIGLNSSMLVTTLLFSFSVSSNIPPASSMVLFAIFLLCVLVFMVCNLVVTIVGVVGWFKYKNERRTSLANVLGLFISLIVPVILFLLLYFVRA